MVVEGKQCKEGDGCNVLSIVPLAAEDQIGFQEGRVSMGIVDAQEWSTPTKGVEYYDTLLLKGVIERDEECISEWVLYKLKDFCVFLVLSYGGLDEETLELFKAIE